ncbi:hypothetical protein ScPMuIL_017548 [Solemya velum]
MADSELDVLEERLDKLENIVFGSADKDAFYPKERHLRKECIENLNNFNTKLVSAVSDKSNVKAAYQKLPELMKILDPAYSETLTLSSPAIVDLILTDENFIEEQAARLEVIEKLQNSVDSEHMRAVPKYENQFQKMSQIHLKQQDQTAELTAEIQDLMAAYNSTITLLSKQFLQWDEIVTKLELSLQRKKPLD